VAGKQLGSKMGNVALSVFAKDIFCVAFFVFSQTTENTCSLQPALKSNAPDL